MRQIQDMWENYFDEFDEIDMSKSSQNRMTSPIDRFKADCTILQWVEAASHLNLGPWQIGSWKGGRAQIEHPETEKPPFLRS